MLIFDAHLDLSLNALEWNRDLRLPVEQIRELENGRSDLAGRGNGTVSFPEMRKGGVGMCVGTLIGGCMKPAGPVASWESPEQAWAMTSGQLEWYRAMEEAGEIRLVKNASEISAGVDAWREDPNGTPIHLLLSLEGADSLVGLSHLERRYADGLRAVGPAHYGWGRYAPGHDRSGPLPEVGKELLKEMDRMGMILDVTHLCEEAFWEALDLYSGAVWASHHNCRALVDDPRQLSDEQIKALADRGSVVGMAFDAWMIVPGWIRGKKVQEVAVSLSDVADHIDHVCQITGGCEHVGIGSDLDGGFGKKQSPGDLDTIADVLKLEGILSDRGYSEDDIGRIFHRNFLDFAMRALPG